MVGVGSVAGWRVSVQRGEHPRRLTFVVHRARKLKGVDAVSLTRRNGEAEESAEFLRRSEIPVKGPGDCSPGDSSRAWGRRERSKTVARASTENKGLADEFAESYAVEVWSRVPWGKAGLTQRRGDAEVSRRNLRHEGGAGVSENGTGVVFEKRLSGFPAS